MPGDALAVVRGYLAFPPPEPCADAEEAFRSARALASCEAERVICNHGGLVEEGVREGLRALAEETDPRPGGN